MGCQHPGGTRDPVRGKTPRFSLRRGCAPAPGQGSCWVWTPRFQEAKKRDSVISALTMADTPEGLSPHRLRLICA